MIQNWVWHGHAGHLCVSNRCYFHLCTDVGNYLVSTVGDFHPNVGRYGEKYIDINKVEEIGLGRLYETMVFKKKEGTCDCGCGLPNIDLTDIDMMAANLPQDARKNHMLMCYKYDAL